ncbi:hypothetical protein [Delftia acidovorans]|uniref:glycine-rich domain-containing protein n=1 Tax=Delftia acidovorans TaxID=80866 RepID=UPI003D09F3C5
MNVSDLLGQNMLEYVSRMILTSETITVSHDGWAIVTGMGGGAGGCKSYSPGNSAPWGVRAQAVYAGDQLAIAIGAGGPAVSAMNTPAIAGGNTIISLNGNVLMTCQGGDAGPANTTTPNPVAAIVLGADYWRRGAAPGGTMNGYIAGGAAVDVGFGTDPGNSGNGDSSVNRIAGGYGAPKGFHFWPFNLTLTGGSSGEIGAGSDSSARAVFFGGGNGFSVSGSPSVINPPGRGGSGGRVEPVTAQSVKPGGDGLGYLRLYKRIGG